MKKEQLSKILDENINVFIDNIVYELEHSHDRFFDDFGFSMFGTSSKDYHEQVYFESYLESYTRKMINSILKDMLDEDSSDEIHFLEQEHNGIYNGYTNSECEKEFLFEFIDYDTKVGYRYSFFNNDEIDELLKMDNVDCIKLIVWNHEDDYIGFSYGDERAEAILVRDLFKELFYDLEENENYEMYTSFVEKISAAVASAKNMISLSTLPGFTPQYIHNNKASVLDDLVHEIKSLSLFSVNSLNHKQKEEHSRQLIIKYGLPHYFLNNRFEKIFVGKSNFAKSFLTSEYLYRYFKNNPMFDFTPIVSGYLKSIEQLLYSICLSYRNSHKIQYSLVTLNDYTNFLSENVDMLRAEVKSAKRTIVDCLKSYRIESRNNLFHKDYFNEWERVEQIRTNTIFLYVALLGSINLQKCNFDLKVLDDTYDRLFENVDKHNEEVFNLYFSDTEFIKMRKERRMAGIAFDKYGQITSKIKFTKLDCDYDEVIEISRKKIPREIWLSDIYGKNTKRIF